MKKQQFDFSRKTLSEGGKVSLILALISLALFLAAGVLSWIMNGKAGVLAGGFGLIGIMLSVYGFATGIRSFREKNVSPLLSVAGSLGCGVMMIIYLTLFLIGLK